MANEWRMANVILGSDKTVESSRHARRLCPIYYVYVRKRVAYFILFAGVVPLVGLLSAAQALGCLGQTVFCPGEAVEPDAERRGS
jgi:hypothetical protein